MDALVLVLVAVTVLNMGLVALSIWSACRAERWARHAQGSAIISTAAANSCEWVMMVGNDVVELTPADAGERR